MCVSLCTCGGSESVSGNSKEEGFTPTVITEIEETDIKDNVLVYVFLKWFENATHFLAGRLAPYKSKIENTPSHSEYASLLPHGGLSPNKKAIINAVTNKFARRYYHFFTRLVA